MRLSPRKANHGARQRSRHSLGAAQILSLMQPANPMTRFAAHLNEVLVQKEAATGGDAGSSDGGRSGKCSEG